MQYKVTGAPDGDVDVPHRDRERQDPRERLGEDEQAEFTMTVGYDDFVKVSKGELDANAAFMQGKIKVTGNMGKVMSLMPFTQSAEYKAVAEKVNESTEY